MVITGQSRSIYELHTQTPLTVVLSAVFIIHVIKFLGHCDLGSHHRKNFINPQNPTNNTLDFRLSA